MNFVKLAKRFFDRMRELTPEKRGDVVAIIIALSCVALVAFMFYRSWGSIETIEEYLSEYTPYTNSYEFWVLTCEFTHEELDLPRRAFNDDGCVWENVNQEVQPRFSGLLVSEKIFMQRLTADWRWGERSDYEDDGLSGWKYRDRFFTLVETAGGREYVTKFCLPWVKWYPPKEEKQQDEFLGLHCRDLNGEHFYEF